MRHILRFKDQCMFCDQHYTVVDEPSDDICDACILPISAPSYNCPNCHLILHKSCAELPGEIHHPLHTQHQLTLLNPRVFTCEACNSDCTGLAFHCAICWLYLDINCSSSPTTIKHEAQDHLLKFQLDFDYICNACCKTVECKGGYKCADCNFNLHMQCALLPRTLTYKYYEHVRTLTCTPIETVSNEYYCILCEDELNPKLWFYYYRDWEGGFHPFCICNVAQIVYWNAKVGVEITVDAHRCSLTSVLKGKQKEWLCVRCHSPAGNIAFECKACEFKVDFSCALMLLEN